MTASLTCTCAFDAISCDVTIAGTPDPMTGMVMHIAELKDVVRNAIGATEVTRAAALPQRLMQVRTCIDSTLPATPRLTSVKLTKHNTSLEWKRTVQGLLLNRSYDFCAGHRLVVSELSVGENQSLFGKCENPHGHNFGLEVTVSGDEDTRPDLLFDTQALDAVVLETVVDRYDHQFLNDHEDFRGLVPTCETMCRVIWERLEAALRQRGLRVTLHRIGLRETPRNLFEYFGDSL